MKNKRSAWWLLPFLFIVFQSCGKMEEPQFQRVENFGIKKIGLQNVVIGFDATFLNPNSFGVTVKEAALDIYVDSIYLGKFTQPKDVSVVKNAEFSIPLEGAVSWNETLASEGKRLLGKEVLLKATGEVKVGKAGVFVSKDIWYQSRHRLDQELLKNPAGAGF
jgi:hypothetical protein